MGIALGITAALSWGLADYSAALASRETGTLRVVLGFHLLATAALAAVVVATGELTRIAWADLPPFALVGAVGWVSYLAFYRALAIGPISVASPIVSGYGAVTVLLAVVLLGDSLGTLEILAVACALAGAALASSELGAVGTLERLAARGPLLAVVAMVCIGGFVFGVAYYSDEFGWLVPLFFARAFTTLLMLITALPGGAWRFPDRSARLMASIAFIAVADTAGYIAFNLGVRHAETAVVATAATPYSVVPIIMGVLLLAERPRRLQWAGIALVLTGLVLLGLGYQ